MQANALVYIVQRNENLSSIVHSRLGEPVYGKAGYLVQVLKNNTHIKNPDRLKVGTKLNLELSQIQNPAVIERKMASEEVSVEEVKLQTESIYTKASLGYNVGVKFVRLDGKDNNPQPAKIIILSKPSPELSIFWKQNFSQLWQGSLQAGVFNVKFQDPSPKHLSKSNIIITDYKYDLKRHFKDSNSHFLFSAGMEESLFLRALNLQVISIERLNLMKIEFGFGHEIYNFKPFTITINASGGVTAPAENSSYKIKLGNFYNLETKLDQQIRNSHLFGSFSFRKLSHKSDQLGSLSRSDLGIKAGYEWSFE